jgi:lipoprotein-releasing system permease protein
MPALKTIHLVLGGAFVLVGVLFIIARAGVTFRMGRPVRAVLLGCGAMLGLGFAGLTYWTLKLPVLRGSMWSLKDTLVKSSAISSGVLFLLTLLLALLPWILDRLEHGRFESFVSARHVRSQKSGFLTVISVLSICGVAVSACAQSSVVSVMGGFSQDLRRKILGNNAHIVIDTESQAAWSGSDEVIARVRAVPGVVAATPVFNGEVMISSPSNLAGVIVRGVDPTSIGDVIELVNNIEVGSFAYLQDSDKLRHLPPDEVIGMGPGGEHYMKGNDMPPLESDDADPLLRLDPAVKDAIATLPPRPGLIVGRELAKTLHVYVGDEVTLVSPLGDPGPMGLMPRTRKFRVAAIFFSGMYEYDASHVYTLLDVAQDYFNEPGKISAIDVKVDDAERADRLTPTVAQAVGRPDLRVRDWREINKNLFGALTLERFATFIILSVLTIVASFCIICTLLLMVTEKGKEIAILKALGASDGAILRTFMTEGIIIGAIGTAFGVATGLAMCTGLAWFGLRLDPDVYYIDRLPISVSAGDFLIVAVSAMTICTLATIYPAQAASKLRPVDGLRYE